MQWYLKETTKVHIQNLCIVVWVIICITTFWNIFDVNRQEIITAYENQIISVEDNEMAKLLNNTEIEYTDNEEVEVEAQGETQTDKAYEGQNHTIITTSDDLDMIKLKVRYNEANEIILLDYDTNFVWPKIGAVLLGAFIASLSILLFDLAFDVLL